MFGVLLYEMRRNKGPKRTELRISDQPWRGALARGDSGEIVYALRLYSRPS